DRDGLGVPSCSLLPYRTLFPIFGQRAERRIHALRQPVQGRGGHGEPFGQRARPSPADADLRQVGADVVVSGAAAAAAPAAEHGVAGDAAAEPAAVHALADGGDAAAPLVARPQRIPGAAGAQVAHVAGEQLDVGAAHAGPLDVHHDLAGPGDGRLDLLDLGLARAGQHQRPHYRGPPTRWRWLPRRSMPSSITSPGRSQICGSWPMPTPGGVPVLIRSPGSSTMNWLRWCTMTYGSKIMVLVVPVCRRTPLTFSHMPRSVTSGISSGVTSQGP